jgi:putative ABC transport system ATP-binding protein
VVFVTHEGDIAEHTRRVIHIRDGRITSDEPVPESRFRDAEEELAALNGQPAREVAA